MPVAISERLGGCVLGGAKTLRRGEAALSNDRAKRALTNRIADLGPHSESKAIHRAASTFMRCTVDYSQINHRNRLGSSHAERHEERYEDS